MLTKLQALQKCEEFIVWSVPETLYGESAYSGDVNSDSDDVNKVGAKRRWQYASSQAAAQDNFGPRLGPIRFEVALRG